jgi:hypothetical protein
MYLIIRQVVECRNCNRIQFQLFSLNNSKTFCMRIRRRFFYIKWLLKIKFEQILMQSIHYRMYQTGLNPFAAAHQKGQRQDQDELQPLHRQHLWQ